MKNTTFLTAVFAVGATGAFAGGMDRSGQSIGAIFQTGTYVELSFGSVTPDVSGNIGGATFSDNMADNYTQIGAAYKRDLTDQLSMAIILDQPFGADVDYRDADATYPLVGATATVDTVGVTALLRYKFNDRFSVHGGVRNLTSEGEVSLPGFPIPGGYSMETSTENDWSWLAGVAYEIPEIALRAALTYNSETTIDFDIDESTPGVFGDTSSNMEVTMPQSVNFDFQTGIAPDTLLMFSVRWAEWTETVIAPNDYGTLVRQNLVDHNGDTTSYSLGLGRRFNDKWSGSVAIGYEDGTGGLSGNLAPRDGYTSLTVGAQYQITEQTAISGGMSYIWIGDAETGIGAEFEDNDAFGVGLKIAHRF